MNRGTGGELGIGRSCATSLDLAGRSTRATHGLGSGPRSACQTLRLGGMRLSWLRLRARSGRPCPDHRLQHKREWDLPVLRDRLYGIEGLGYRALT